MVRDGGVIARGYDAELDELREIENAARFLIDLEARERARTGIGNLRVEYNHVHGFYIEVTRGQTAKVPDDYRRRQTLKNAERYITPELKTFEDKALSAQERALAREKPLYDALLDALAPHLGRLQRVARALAALDVLAALAERRRARSTGRPAFVKRAAASTSRGTPSGRRGAPERRALHRQRRRARRRSAHADHHRPEHGRQVDLHAAGRADRAARFMGTLCRRRAGSGPIDRSSRASAPPTTSPAGRRLSWSR